MHLFLIFASMPVDPIKLLSLLHLTSRPKLQPFLAFTKQAVGGDVVEVFVEPSETVYHGPVIIIISRSSYSAAELLPLSEREPGVDSWFELALKTSQDAASPTSDVTKVLVPAFSLLFSFLSLLPLSNSCNPNVFSDMDVPRAKLIAVPIILQLHFLAKKPIVDRYSCIQLTLG